MRRGRLALGTLISITFAAVPGASALSGRCAGELCDILRRLTRARSGELRGNRMNRLDNDLLRELHADAETHIADLANNIRMLGEQADFLLLAEAHFTEPMSDLGSCGELLDANGSSCANVT